MKPIKQYPFLRNLIICTVICAGLAALYSTVIPADYTSANNGADGGDLLTAILVNGVPHPGGYPTYLLLGKLFQLIPGGTPYFKGALLSLVFAVLGVGIVMAACGLLLAGNGVSQAVGMAAAGISLGLAPLFWSQAVIVEVYGLQSFFTACFLLWLVVILRCPLTRKVDFGLTLLSLLVGLGVGNHLTILLILPAMALVIVRAARQGISRILLLKYSALVLLAALVVYAYLPLLARGYPPVNWGNPQTIEGFTWLVSGQLYKNLAFGLAPAEYLGRAGAWASLILKQFNILGLFLGIWGAVQAFSGKDVLKWVSLWIFVITSLFSIGYLTNDSSAYLIPSLMIFALWIGFASQYIWAGIGGENVWGKVLIAAFLLTLLARLPAVRREVDPRRDTSTRSTAGACLGSLPPKAILITQADTDTFALWYLHFGLGERADVQIVVRGLADFDWYRTTLAHTAPGLNLPAKGTQDWLAQISLLNPANPACESWIDPLDSTRIECKCDEAQ